MNILILGAGGREHTFAWKIAQSPLCKALFVAPGNSGTASLATNLAISVTDFQGIKKQVLAHSITMVVVGPEDPLVNGIYDFFLEDSELQHVAVIGPQKAAAQLEGSKEFAKTTNKIAKIGRNIPIPFSEIFISPGKIRDTYVNNPNNKRFIKIEILPNTNCSCLFLNKNIAINVMVAESKNSKEIPFNKKESSLKRSITNVGRSEELHKLNTKISPPEIILASSK